MREPAVVVKLIKANFSSKISKMYVMLGPRAGIMPNLAHRALGIWYNIYNNLFETN